MYGEPKVFRHDIGPIEALGMAGAQAYGKLDSKFLHHVEDNVRHITDKERNDWNSKVSKTEFDGTISTITSKLKNINAVISNYSGFSAEDDDKLVTFADLETKLQNYVTISDFTQGAGSSNAPVYEAIEQIAEDTVSERLSSAGITDGPEGTVVTKNALKHTMSVNGDNLSIDFRFDAIPVENEPVIEG